MTPELSRIDALVLFAVYELSGGDVDVSVSKEAIYQRTSELLAMATEEYKEHRQSVVARTRTHRALRQAMAEVARGS